MESAGRLLLRHFGEEQQAIERFACHPSDTVRGWAAYMVGGLPNVSLARRLQQIRPLADDPHFGVREWAWLALRTHIAGDIEASIARLERWTGSRSENLRRYAVESTRPRGVWCTHVTELKDSPEIGLPILEPAESRSVEVRSGLGGELAQRRIEVPAGLGAGTLFAVGSRVTVRSDRADLPPGTAVASQVKG